MRYRLQLQRYRLHHPRIHAATLCIPAAAPRIQVPALPRALPAC